MLKGKTLKNYCELVIKLGVNLQPGQGLIIACPVEKAEIAHALTQTAYNNGASIVRVRWSDEIIDRLCYDYASIENLKEVPKWMVMEREYIMEKGFCYVAISAEDPNAFNGVPAEKISALSISRSKAFKKFSDCVMANGVRWCVVSVPTEEWSKKVFPASDTPLEELSDAIEKTMRLDSDNPLLAWQQHIDKLECRANFLNKKRFNKLKFISKNGTNISVGLADGHIWLSAKEKAKDGVSFIANLPTEEVFTAPHCERVNGTVKSAMPLIYNGQTIDEFTLTFENGKIVDFDAKLGYEALKALLKTDKGILSIGEVALIGKNSPIAQSGILFYNTLFDENASCHLALGKAYPTTILGGEKLSDKQLKERGANDSIEHVDFMIGTSDLVVVGIESNGEQTLLFENGDWVI